MLALTKLSQGSIHSFTCDRLKHRTLAYSFPVAAMMNTADVANKERMNEWEYGIGDIARRASSERQQHSLRSSDRHVTLS
jgi:hypothetical protein